eukprot:ANDGO_01920.mRNA.1 hypothetical protein
MIKCAFHYNLFPRSAGIFPLWENASIVSESVIGHDRYGMFLTCTIVCHAHTLYHAYVALYDAVERKFDSVCAIPLKENERIFSATINRQRTVLVFALSSSPASLQILELHPGCVPSSVVGCTSPALTPPRLLFLGDSHILVCYAQETAIYTLRLEWKKKPPKGFEPPSKEKEKEREKGKGKEGSHAGDSRHHQHNHPQQQQHQHLQKLSVYRIHKEKSHAYQAFLPPLARSAWVSETPALVQIDPENACLFLLYARKDTSVFRAVLIDNPRSPKVVCDIELPIRLADGHVRGLWEEEQCESQTKWIHFVRLAEGAICVMEQGMEGPGRYRSCVYVIHHRCKLECVWNVETPSTKRPLLSLFPLQNLGILALPGHSAKILALANDVIPFELTTLPFGDDALLPAAADSILIATPRMPMDQWFCLNRRTGVVSSCTLDWDGMHAAFLNRLQNEISTSQLLLDIRAHLQLSLYHDPRPSHALELLRKFVRVSISRGYSETESVNVWRDALLGYLFCELFQPSDAHSTPPSAPKVSKGFMSGALVKPPTSTVSSSKAPASPRTDHHHHRDTSPRKGDALSANGDYPVLPLTGAAKRLIVTHLPKSVFPFASRSEIRAHLKTCSVTGQYSYTPQNSIIYPYVLGVPDRSADAEKEKADSQWTMWMTPKQRTEADILVTTSSASSNSLYKQRIALEKVSIPYSILHHASSSSSVSSASSSSSMGVQSPSTPLSNSTEMIGKLFGFLGFSSARSSFSAETSTSFWNSSLRRRVAARKSVVDQVSSVYIDQEVPLPTWLALEEDGIRPLQGAPGDKEWEAEVRKRVASRVDEVWTAWDIVASWVWSVVQKEIDTLDKSLLSSSNTDGGLLARSFYCACESFGLLTPLPCLRSASAFSELRWSPKALAIMAHHHVFMTDRSRPGGAGYERRWEDFIVRHSANDRRQATRFALANGHSNGRVEYLASLFDPRGLMPSIDETIRYLEACSVAHESADAAALQSERNLVEVKSSEDSASPILEGTSPVAPVESPLFNFLPCAILAAHMDAAPFDRAHYRPHIPEETPKSTKRLDLLSGLSRRFPFFAPEPDKKEQDGRQDGAREWLVLRSGLRRCLARIDKDATMGLPAEVPEIVDL